MFKYISGSLHQEDWRCLNNFGSLGLNPVPGCQLNEGRTVPVLLKFNILGSPRMGIELQYGRNNQLLQEGVLQIRTINCGTREWQSKLTQVMGLAEIMAGLVRQLLYMVQLQLRQQNTSREGTFSSFASQLCLRKVLKNTSQYEFFESSKANAGEC